jgi:hypothetical protein
VGTGDRKLPHPGIDSDKQNTNSHRHEPSPPREVFLDKKKVPEKESNPDTSNLA